MVRTWGQSRTLSRSSHQSSTEVSLDLVGLSIEVSPTQNAALIFKTSFQEFHSQYCLQQKGTDTLTSLHLEHAQESCLEDAVHGCWRELYSGPGAGLHMKNSWHTKIFLGPASTLRFSTAIQCFPTPGTVPGKGIWIQGGQSGEGHPCLTQLSRVSFWS